MLKLRACGHRDLERIYPAFELDFDKKELLPKLGVHKALLRGDAELLAVYDEDTGIEVAYALVGVRSLYGYVWLKYFSVSPWYRDKGLGVQAMRLINRRYADRQGILAELTAFGDEDGSTLRKLRRFFARFGYVEIPSDVTIGGEKACVVVKPLQGSEEISPYVHRILRDFYSRVLTGVGMQRMVELRPAPKEE